MLERLVAWFCNNYLGRYLENLNTDQLSVALLQGNFRLNFTNFHILFMLLLNLGEVELENVPLRGDILDQLGLPVKIHAGFIGKICFQIPLRKIRSEPWVISFEQLYLVAGPQDKNEVRTFTLNELDGTEILLRNLFDVSSLLMKKLKMLHN